MESGRLRATTDFSAVLDLDTINICVPTPLRKTGDPDLSFIVSATEALAPYLHPGGMAQIALRDEGRRLPARIIHRSCPGRSGNCRRNWPR